MDSAHPVIKISHLSQVCVVVNDLEKSMASMWNTFGIGPWNIGLRDPDSKIENDSLRDMTYHGKPARFSYKVASTQGKLGDIILELIQPTFGPTIYRDFLNKHGEGIQHLGWQVVKSPEEFKETWQKLEAAGFPCLMSGVSYKADWAYFDTTKVLGTFLEVVWRNPAKPPLPPKDIYPKQ